MMSLNEGQSGRFHCSTVQIPCRCHLPVRELTPFGCHMTNRQMGIAPPADQVISVMGPQ